MQPIAVITGAAQGLGRVIAKQLLADGFRVAITDRDREGAERLARELDPEGGRALALALDVTRKEDFSAALDAVEARLGAPTALVNNAAMTPTTPVMEITPEEFDAVVAINLRGTFFGCQVFGDYFAGRGYGRIVNIASLAGQNGGTASGAHYAASKGAILTLTKVFAGQLAAANVTVNAVAPGPLDLPSVRAAVPADKLASIVERVIPVKRLGNPAFVATTVARLLGDEADFVTGAAWDINGGIHMR